MIARTRSSTRGRFVASALCAVSIASPPTAAADPVFPQAGNGPAIDTITALQSQGYDVRINWLEGEPNVPLRECLVRRIDTDGAAPVASALVIAYVDVTCPNAK
jgi:hypothetical protein